MRHLDLLVHDVRKIVIDFQAEFRQPLHDLSLVEVCPTVLACMFSWTLVGLFCIFVYYLATHIHKLSEYVSFTVALLSSMSDVNFHVVGHHGYITDGCISVFEFDNTSKSSCACPTLCTFTSRRLPLHSTY